MLLLVLRAKNELVSSKVEESLATRRTARTLGVATVLDALLQKLEVNSAGSSSCLEKNPSWQRGARNPLSRRRLFDVDIKTAPGRD